MAYPFRRVNGDAGALDDLSTEPLDPRPDWEGLGRILVALRTATPEQREELLAAARAAAGKHRMAHALVDRAEKRER